MRKIWKIDYNNWKKNWKIQTILTNMRNNRTSTGENIDEYAIPENEVYKKYYPEKP